LPAEAEIRLAGIVGSVAAGEVPGAGESYSQRDVTILLADLRGFAAIAESYAPAVVLEILNRCFGAMTRIIGRHHGTIDKFMGDAIMVVFPGEAGAPREHARRAVLCAVEMQIAMNELRGMHRSGALPEMFMGIGINSGKVMAGLVGSELYRAHTVIGGEVNLAARIEAFCLRGQILVSESTYDRCAGFVEAGEPIRVHMKGKAHGIVIREVKAVPSLGKSVPSQEVRRSPRVDVLLPFAYHLLEGKTVMAEPFTGTIHDIGYHGALAEIDQALELYGEIKVELDLARLNYRADDVYARVVKTRSAGDRHLIGMEFTSLSRLSSEKIELFVQLLIQEALLRPRM
jgi:adenylate cyclase